MSRTSSGSWRRSSPHLRRATRSTGETRTTSVELLGDAFELELERNVSLLELESGDEYWDLFSTSYGPTKTLAESLGDRREELHQAWSTFFEENNRENGGIVHRREYLLVLGRRR